MERILAINVRIVSENCDQVDKYAINISYRDCIKSMIVSRKRRKANNKIFNVHNQKPEI